MDFFSTPTGYKLWIFQEHNEWVNERLIHILQDMSLISHHVDQISDAAIINLKVECCSENYNK